LQEHADDLTTADGLTLHTVRWLPEHDPAAVIFIVHGFAEHSGRYRHVAEFLVGCGYAVYSLDHRGHGRSEGLRVYFDSFDQPIDDLALYLQQIKAAHPGKKIFVFGHSMGSLISMVFVYRNQHELAGWITSGTPLLMDTTWPQVLIRLMVWIDRIMPRLFVGPLNLLAISRDPAVVHAYKADLLVYPRPLRARLVSSGLAQIQKMRERVREFTLPLLILHGTGDKLTPFSGSEYIYQHAASDDKTLKLYDGLYHELHNEPEQETVLNDIAAWLDAHVNGQ
jgi:acylglycerol lipase